MDEDGEEEVDISVVVEAVAEEVGVVEEVRVHCEVMVHAETLEETKTTRIAGVVRQVEGVHTKEGHSVVVVANIRARTGLDMMHPLALGMDRLRALEALVKRTKTDGHLQTSRLWDSRFATCLGLGVSFLLHPLKLSH